ncbi:MAG: AtpZ/AtpI family protein [Alphaproteobacteria bacterium]|nr:AtpZ/AtpI family protein [Alphaproteobacteria bacterium]
MALFNPNRETEKLLIKKAQKLKGKSRDSSVQIRITVLSVFGWYMCAPVLIGIALGRFADKHIPVDDFSWTLSFIGIGFAFSFAGIHYWMRKERKELLLHLRQKRNAEREERKIQKIYTQKMKHQTQKNNSTITNTKTKDKK